MEFVEKELDKLAFPFKVPEILPDALFWRVEISH